MTPLDDSALPNCPYEQTLLDAGCELETVEIRPYLTCKRNVDADLRGADLRGADLQRAYLTGADLTGANLQRANLTGADLTDADLVDFPRLLELAADLTDVIGYP